MQNPELVFPCHSGFVRNSYLALEGFHKPTLSLCLEGILLSNSSIEWLWTKTLVERKPRKILENDIIMWLSPKRCDQPTLSPPYLGEVWKVIEGRVLFLLWAISFSIWQQFLFTYFDYFYFSFFTFNGNLCLKKNISFHVFGKSKISARGQKKVAQL